MEEIWKDIEDYDELYQVSNLGRVKRLIGLRCKEERFIKPLYRKGYHFVFLYRNSKYKTMSIHRLVALSFLINKYNKMEVNHIDGVKTNNCVENLEWSTRSENTRHAFDTGLIKATSKKLIDYATGVAYDSIRKASSYYPFTETYLAKMLRGERPNRTNLQYYNPTKQ